MIRGLLLIVDTALPERPSLSCSPLSPAYVPWPAHFPAFFPSAPAPAAPLPASCPTPVSSPAPSAASSGSVTAEPPAVRFADVGCGFGGLLVKLAPLYPDTLMLGMELRDKVRPTRASRPLPATASNSY